MENGKYSLTLQEKEDFARVKLLKTKSELGEKSLSCEKMKMWKIYLIDFLRSHSHVLKDFFLLLSCCCVFPSSFSRFSDDTTHIQKMCELFRSSSMWGWKKKFLMLCSSFLVSPRCCCRLLYCEKFIAIKLKEIKANCELLCEGVKRENRETTTKEEWRKKLFRRLHFTRFACLLLV